MAFTLLDTSDQDRGYLSIFSCHISLPNSLEHLWQTEKNVIVPNSLAKSTLLLYEYKSTAGVHWLICMGIKKELLCYQKHKHSLVKAQVLLLYDFENIVGVQWLIYVGVKKHSLSDQKYRHSLVKAHVLIMHLNFRFC